MIKSMLFLGAQENQTAAQFEAAYLGEHAERLAAMDCIHRLVENVLRQPTPEMIDAGWGWGSNDETGILAIDEIWTDDDVDVLALYEGENVICAYVVDQYDQKKCLEPIMPIGEKSPWLKRMGLLRKPADMRMQDFFGYWKDIHGPKALKIHIGAVQYEQNRFVKVLKEKEGEPWHGSMSLYYFSINDFRYAHFSFPGAQQIIAEDVANFQKKFLALPYGEEYVMKR